MSDLSTPPMSHCKCVQILLAEFQWLLSVYGHIVHTHPEVVPQQNIKLAKHIYF